MLVEHPPIMPSPSAVVSSSLENDFRHLKTVLDSLTKDKRYTVQEESYRHEPAWGMVIVAKLVETASDSPEPVVSYVVVWGNDGELPHIVWTFDQSSF